MGPMKQAAVRALAVPVSRTSRRWQWAVVMVAVAAYLLGSLWFLWDYTTLDDAFITYRYARNFVAGEGMVFNPGDRVEGYSSLSWLLLLSAGEALGLDLPSFSRCLGLVFGLGTLLIVAFGPFDAIPRLLTVGLLVVYLPWVYHTINGLETALVSFLLVALLLLPAETKTSQWARVMAAVILVITRPEGLGLALIASAAAWFAERGRFRGHHLGVCGAGLAAFLGQTIWRWLYYGDWIANSARAKLMPMNFALPRGLDDLGRFAFYGSAFGGFSLLAVSGVLLALKRRKEPESRRLFALFALCVLGGLALAASGGDTFPFWRFLVPLSPVWILCAAQGLHLVAGSGRRGFATRVAAVVLLFMALGFFFLNFFDQVKNGLPLAERWKNIGVALAKEFQPETRIALPQVGLVPYYSGLHTIDMLGLNERTIARRPPDLSYYNPGHHRHDGPYVLDLQPDLIMLANGPIVLDKSDGFPWRHINGYELDLVRDPRFAEQYRMINLPLPSGGYVQMLAHAAFLERHRHDRQRAR